ncbi:MAG TPA: protocatechuate 3,4-dioxygenase subunit alpha [Pseudolysinimonas sp.]|nr:protocatechuate 3,4-dioxygenase subunit alpha [Pseudolysinimonas sp.]
MPDSTEPASTVPDSFGQTPSQTVGPFFGYALPYPGGEQIAPATHPDAIRLHGTVYDGAGAPVPDALIELWHADAAGRPIRERGSLHRDGYTVTGFGRAPVDADGRFSFTTVKPGAADAAHAPFALVTVFARGLLHHLFTRAYFGDEPQANAADAFLAGIDPQRRDTLIAQEDGPASYRFDIRLQGEGETVFIEYAGDE